MKAFTLTLTTILFIGFFTSNTCKAQTHRLLSKIEETERNNNVWDKITVMLPHQNYTLNKVTYENNTLLVLFEYTRTIDASKTLFTFNLSDYGIDCQTISVEAAFRVVANPKGTEFKTANWLPNDISDKSADPPINTFRCPVYCPF